MKKLALGVAAAALVSFVAGSAIAQSAKFTAAWETDKIALAEFNINHTATGDTIVAAEETMSTIHVPNKKELLIGVSGVANVVTFTEAKGKNGGFKSIAVAEGGLRLSVRVVPQGVSANCGGDVPEGGMEAAPDALTFTSRRQELSVTVDLDIVDVGECGDDQTCADDLEIVGDVTVALGLDTTAAHHFNFVAPDLGQGTYVAAACFTGTASGSVTEEEDGAMSLSLLKFVGQASLVDDAMLPS